MLGSSSGKLSRTVFLLMSKLSRIEWTGILETRLEAKPWAKGSGSPPTNPRQRHPQSLSEWSWDRVSSASKRMRFSLLS